MSIRSDINEALSGAPDTAIKIILIGIALACIALVLWGTPTVRAVSAAWFVFP